jgi:hypothetical protein
MCAREIATESLASVKLVWLDQGAAIASAPARQPEQGAFCFIDDDARAPEFSDNLPLR